MMLTELTKYILERILSIDTVVFCASYFHIFDKIFEKTDVFGEMVGSKTKRWFSSTAQLVIGSP